MTLGDLLCDSEGVGDADGVSPAMESAPRCAWISTPCGREPDAVGCVCVAISLNGTGESVVVC